MHRPGRQSFDVLSISALDIFASALGVFILMAILMFPYYLKAAVPRRLEQAGAKAELAARPVLQKARSPEPSPTPRRMARKRRPSSRRRKARLARAAAPAQGAGRNRWRREPSQLDTPLFLDDLDLVVVLDTTKSMKRELADSAGQSDRRDQRAASSGRFPAQSGWSRTRTGATPI